MNKGSMISVPFIAYEKEMEHKNNIIKFMSGFIIGLIILIIVMFYMFMSFINSYDYKNYDQDGNGINNINSGNQGDIINESDITN